MGRNFKWVTIILAIPQVALPVRAWVEIWKYSCYFFRFIVALHVRAWVEILIWD